MPKAKKSANYFKFAKEMRRIYGTEQRIRELTQRQYRSLREGVRDHRIADGSIYAWDLANGEW